MHKTSILTPRLLLLFLRLIPGGVAGGVAASNTAAKESVESSKLVPLRKCSSSTAVNVVAVALGERTCIAVLPAAVAERVTTLGDDGDWNNLDGGGAAVVVILAVVLKI